MASEVVYLGTHMVHCLLALISAYVVPSCLGYWMFDNNKMQISVNGNYSRAGTRGRWVETLALGTQFKGVPNIQSLRWYFN